jgi:hypothetical protein
MSKLTAWRTPFEAERFPSVWVTCEGGQLDKTSVFIGWPAEWQVTFEHVVGLKVCDERYDNNPRFWVDGNEANLCSYIWDDSPWLREFNSEYVEAMEDGDVIHYVLLGGDHNVEVLAFGNVQINPADSIAR